MLLLSLLKLAVSKDSFRNTIIVSNSLDILLGLFWAQSVCKGYQQMTKVTASKERARDGLYR